MNDVPAVPLSAPPTSPSLPPADHTPVSPAEAQIAAAIRDLGPAQTVRQWLNDNLQQAASLPLDNGAHLAAQRTAVFVTTIRHWIQQRHAELGYDKPFAVVAIGGTGRNELTPQSDLDFAFLFDDALEGNSFLAELQRDIVHGGATFKARHGFSCRPLPFSFDDAPTLEGKQLNAFLDMRPVYDPHQLCPRFRDRIRATYDPFAHFLYVRRFWQEQLDRPVAACERIDRFDIKTEGLRVFLAGIWTLASARFTHSHDIYPLLDPRDLEAYYFLLRIRALIAARRTLQTNTAPQPDCGPDHVLFADYSGFGALLGPDAGESERDAFANETRALLLAARRRVMTFARSAIGAELRRGRPVPTHRGLGLGPGGLHSNHPHMPSAPRERSRIALSLLHAAQRYGVAIDPVELQRTWRNAGDWLEPTPELTTLFYERHGSLASSFEFLSQLPGAEDRLFRGYTRFEASVDARVLAQQTHPRGALERQKIRALEHLLTEGRTMLQRSVHASKHGATLVHGVSGPVEAALLDPDHLAAVKLALKTKRLPVTFDDLLARADPNRSGDERFHSGMSGIPLAQYYEPFAKLCDFPAEALRMTEFLLAHRRAFKERSLDPVNDPQQVASFAELCGDEHHLRALYVFTLADRAEWESEQDAPSRWFNTHELYCQTMARFRPGLDPARSLETCGFAPEQITLLRDFGAAFFDGIYSRYAQRFGTHLTRLAENPADSTPKAALIREGSSNILAVAARDFRGLATCITGTFWEQQVECAQAHLFSAMNQGLVLDFFHLAPRQRIEPTLLRTVEDAIRTRRHLHDDQPDPQLPPLQGRTTLVDWRAGQFCLRFEGLASPGLLYALTWRTYRHLGGNVFALSAHRGGNVAYVSLYLNLPQHLDATQARHIVQQHFASQPA